MIFVLLFAMTTTISQSSPLYSWPIKDCTAGVGCTAESGNTCSDGYEKIFDEDDCAAALQSFKDGTIGNPSEYSACNCNPDTLHYTGLRSYSWVPNGCFWNAGGCTEFNVNSNGDDTAQAYPVLCKRSATPCAAGTFSATGDDSAGPCQSCTLCSYGTKDECTLSSDTECVTCDEHVETLQGEIQTLTLQYADAQAAFDANMETFKESINPFDILNEPVNAALFALSGLGLVSIGYFLGKRKSNVWIPIPE